MTLRSRLLALFPMLVGAAALASLVWFVLAPHWLPALSFVFLLYGLPLLAFRLHERLWPLQEGFSSLTGGDYSPWWGGHQIQLIYMAFPALETVLRLVPGLFSLWLRLWGSEIGRGIYWTPHLQVGDRSMLKLGEGVVVGQSNGIFGHIIQPKASGLLLLVRRVEIGAGAFIGAGGYIGPGVRIEAGAVIEAGARLKPNEKRAP